MMTTRATEVGGFELNALLRNDALLGALSAASASTQLAVATNLAALFETVRMTRRGGIASRESNGQAD